MGQQHESTPRLAVSVLGTGYLGAVHATALASIGFDVVAVDVDSAKVAALAAGRTPFHEPGFDDLLTTTLGTGRLRFTTDPSEIAGCAVHFICVGTPQSASGDEADLTAVWSVTEALRQYAPDNSVVAGKSTVPVGTAPRIQDLLDSRGPQAPVVVWNPEFLREGFAIEDTLRPDRIVIGRPAGDRGLSAAAVMREVYADQIDAGIPFIETDLTTAELVKVAANAFLATKISFINAMAEVCEATGGDVVELADAIGHDARIGRRFLNAGVGFGGGCLPKDIRAFGARARELGVGRATEFLSWADDVNLRRRDRVVDIVRGLVGGDLAGAQVTVLGAAFKPDSDDVRDSPGLSIAERLLAGGARVRVTDPQALPNAVQIMPGIEPVADTVEALRDADVVVLATEWQEYASLDPHRCAELVAHTCIVDGRNALPADVWRDAGWRVVGMGRPDLVDVRQDRRAAMASG